jgi:hypothetical protein
LEKGSASYQHVLGDDETNRLGSWFADLYAACPVVREQVTVTNRNVILIERPLWSTRRWGLRLLRLDCLALQSDTARLLTAKSEISVHDSGADLGNKTDPRRSSAYFPSALSKNSSVKNFSVPAGRSGAVLILAA